MRQNGNVPYETFGSTADVTTDAPLVLGDRASYKTTECAVRSDCNLLCRLASEEHEKSNREGAGGNVCAHFCLGHKLEEKGMRYSPLPSGAEMNRLWKSFSACRGSYSSDTKQWVKYLLFMNFSVTIPFISRW